MFILSVKVKKDIGNNMKHMTRTEKLRCQKIIDTIDSIEAGGNHNQLPVVWKSAEGSIVRDQSGRKYIDFTSTIFVANCGHGANAHAIRMQSQELVHSYTFPTEIKAKFLTKFKAFLPTFCEKIFLASAGSEVTSWAVNLMRAYKGKRIIVHIDGAFHGKTGVVEQLSHEEIRLPFDLDDPYQLEAILKELESRKDEIAGFLLESYQGWSAKFMNKAYVKALVEWANLNDVPVCFDEIQGGFYRTEKKFAYEWYEVEPDLICMGKGLGNGYPLSALSGRAKYFNVSGLSSTHSGNPLACAAGLEAIKLYEKLDKTSLSEKSKLLAETLKKLAEQYPKLIKSVQSTGMLASVICVDKDKASTLCYEAKDLGLLLVHTGRESIKIGPPLTITMPMLSKGLTLLSQALESVDRMDIK